MEDPAGRATLSERIGIDPGRLRVGESRFLLSPRDLTILPRQGSPPHPTILAIHGLGMRIETFSRWLQPVFDENWACLLPEGPYPLERRLGGLRQIGHAWYLWEGDTPAFRRSLRQSEERILAILPERAAAHGLDPTRMVALGFSQGAVFAGSLALRSPERFRGLVIAAGRVRSRFSGNEAGMAPRWPVLFLHGVDDDVVPIEGARESAAELERAGFDVTFSTAPGGHIWSDAMTRNLLDWLLRLGL